MSAYVDRFRNVEQALFKICLCIWRAHLREIGADESLLHADPYRDGYQQLLVRFLQLVSRSREQLDAAQFLAIRASLLLAVPGRQLRFL